MDETIHKQADGDGGLKNVSQPGGDPAPEEPAPEVPETPAIDTPEVPATDTPSDEPDEEPVDPDKTDDPEDEE